MSELVEAARAEDIDKLQVLLDGGASILESDRSGQTALMAAIQAKNKKIVQLLLNNGASKGINQQDINGWTALHFAADDGDLDIFSQLLALGKDIDVDIKDRFGMTPIMVATWHGHIGLVQLLLALHADDIDITAQIHDDMTNDSGKTVFHIAAENDMATNGRGASIISLLLKHPQARKVFRLTAKNEHTPLQTAAQYGRAEIVERLLQEDPAPPASKHHQSAYNLANKAGYFFAGQHNEKLFQLLSPYAESKSYLHKIGSQSDQSQNVGWTNRIVPFFQGKQASKSKSQTKNAQSQNNAPAKEGSLQNFHNQL